MENGKWKMIKEELKSFFIFRFPFSIFRF